MMMILLTSLAGSLGAVTRYIIGLYIKKHIKGNFPFPTLIINSLGSLFLALIVYSPFFSHFFWRSIVGIGFLGAFTTFSTFSIEIVSLWTEKRKVSAVLYLLFSMILSVGIFVIAGYFFQ